MDEQVRRDTERWFVRRGLPHFIHPYRATDDVFTRMLPLLAFVAVLLVMVDAVDEGYEPWLNALAIVLALLFLGTVVVVANLVRGRPGLSRPRRVGPVELTIFVVVPTIVPLGRLDWAEAVETLTTTLVLLGIIYLGTSFGIVPIGRWTLTHGLHRLASAASVLLRALPLLLLIIIVVFVNMEAWQVADGLEWPAVLIVAALFFVLGSAFALVRVPRQVGQFGRDANISTALGRYGHGTPDASPPVPGLFTLLPDLERELPPPPPLSRRERINVALVVLVSEAILILLVVLMMFGFLIVFGMLTISPAVVERWLDADPDALVSWHLFQQEMVLTPVLLKVSAFLAALSGLSFTVSLLSDATYQEEFLSDLDDDLGEALAVRVVYRARESGADPSIIPST